MRGIIVIALVVVALVGGILTLRSTRSVGMPGKDVLDRAKQRERDQDAKDEGDADR